MATDTGSAHPTNGEEMDDQEALRIAAEQTDAASVNADKADKDWDGEDVDAPAPE